MSRTNSGMPKIAKAKFKEVTITQIITQNAQGLKSNDKIKELVQQINKKILGYNLKTSLNKLIN